MASSSTEQKSVQPAPSAQTVLAAANRAAKNGFMHPNWLKLDQGDAYRLAFGIFGTDPKLIATLFEFCDDMTPESLAVILTTAKEMESQKQDAQIAAIVQQENDQQLAAIAQQEKIDLELAQQLDSLENQLTPSQLKSQQRALEEAKKAARLSAIEEQKQLINQAQAKEKSIAKASADKARMEQELAAKEQELIAKEQEIADKERDHQEMLAKLQLVADLGPEHSPIPTVRPAEPKTTNWAVVAANSSATAANSSTTAANSSAMSTIVLSSTKSSAPPKRKTTQAIEFHNKHLSDPNKKCTCTHELNGNLCMVPGCKKVHKNCNLGNACNRLFCTGHEGEENFVPLCRFGNSCTRKDVDGKRHTFAGDRMFIAQKEILCVNDGKCPFGNKCLYRHVKPNNVPTAAPIDQDTESAN